MINSIPFNVVPRHWLRLYTDAALLQSLGAVVLESKKEVWLESIRKLDMAIIVAGAVGRKEWILATIRDIQAQFPSPDDDDDRPLKKARLYVEPSLLYAPNPIPVLHHPPSIDTYLSTYLKHPFILRGHLNSSSNPPWPACNRWCSTKYLLEKVGRGRVVPVEVGEAYDDESWTQKIIPFTEFLVRAGFDAQDLPESSPLYLAQYALFDQFPELEKDICYPDYVWSSPPPMESYSPPDDIIVNVWVGSGNEEIVSPAHTVIGRKRVWVAPPSCRPHMHAHGGDKDLADQYMTNTSKVPILRPTNDFKTIQSDYPEFFRHVWPVSLEAVLEPGDLMVMPPGWWHAMRGEGSGPAWSISMWY
ncbi:uncharacterized protein IL334_004976 [Kwoniella shivajii]|uniref:JmjC domain-containing protein n=1 Tax=Kwoniella shivajii TaxID=564305 RepID=A0ABZ1D4V5_9TREE|nr:hypothetical protein IL334_004976 [Kwoniella shivajii]